MCIDTFLSYSRQTAQDDDQEDGCCWMTGGGCDTRSSIHTPDEAMFFKVNDEYFLFHMGEAAKIL
ncbi:hypothetical protein DCAR_0208299 [Daucus carota subsp. sativus]|uniref:Uncharacterized protein n=1 Tax=Daucus carota subsp. sativus TaxID=79200 RepID=A0A166EG28_DAUCS|nr:hypothetical protein DCAR_0208299 [Daucus carota subsp. sativus]